MFDSQIIFNLINFAVVIAFFTFVYKKYVKDSAIKDIHDREQYLIDLKNQKETLDVLQRKVLNSMEQEKIYFDSLLEKAAEWKKAFANQRQKEDAFAQRRYDLLKEKVQVQARNLNQRKREDIIVPQIVSELRHDLERRYSEVERNKKYINKILLSMENSSR